MTLKWRKHKLDVKISLRKNLEISFAYNSGSAPARVFRQLLLKGINDACYYSKDITFPANKYHWFLRSIVKRTWIVVSVRKSVRQTFDGFAFVTACSNFHLMILPRRPTDTLFHRRKHLHTHLAARNTLTREISRPIRTILVFDQIICVSFGI